MTHDDLLRRINIVGDTSIEEALRAVVELHKPSEPEYPDDDVFYCVACSDDKASISYFYPCKTIQAIEKELG